MASSINRSVVLIPVVAALVLAALWVSIAPDSLVVYCAHDAVYAKQILEDFTRQTGIQIQVRFDTEATKSLGLVNSIVQERSQPRCDVFWNNELLGMAELREQGLLEPYRGSGWQRIPERYRDAEGHWVGFAARLRVLIFNTQQASADDDTFQNLIALEPARVAMAKPLFGTTLTHFTVLWHVWGGERLKAWHLDLRLRGLREMDGNAAVKDVVASGICDAGLTDTDDVFVAIDNGMPVEMLPVRLTGSSAGQSLRDSEPNPTQNGSSPHHEPDNKLTNSTICIPNTVGIIKGTKRLQGAQRLVDFLASAETELALAQSKSRQIPLGPVDRLALPEDVQRLARWSIDGIDLRSLLPARRACLKWLKDEYLK